MTQGMIRSGQMNPRGIRARGRDNRIYGLNSWHVSRSNYGRKTGLPFGSCFLGIANLWIFFLLWIGIKLKCFFRCLPSFFLSFFLPKNVLSILDLFLFGNSVEISQMIY